MADTVFENVFTRIAAVIGGVTGINFSSNTMLESLTEFPAGVCFPTTGNVKGQDADTVQGIHRIVALLALPRGDIAMAETDIRPILERVYKAIWADPTLGSTQDYKPAVIDLDYTYGPLTIAKTPLLVCRFELEIKLRQPTT